MSYCCCQTRVRLARCRLSLARTSPFFTCHCFSRSASQTGFLGELWPQLYCGCQPASPSQKSKWSSWVVTLLSGNGPRCFVLLPLTFAVKAQLRSCLILFAPLPKSSSRERSHKCLTIAVSNKTSLLGFSQVWLLICLVSWCNCFEFKWFGPIAFGP